jgi:hypothetical protein
MTIITTKDWTPTSPVFGEALRADAANKTQKLILVRNSTNIPICGMIQDGDSVIVIGYDKTNYLLTIEDYLVVLD